jgi:hypothetical protein
MGSKLRYLILLSICASLAIVMTATPASAHQHRIVGGIETTVGWLDEPAYAGFKNGVSFRAERRAAGADQDAAGTPVTGATLKVEITFGTEKAGPLDLEPAFGDPGHYETTVIPTRPGTYTFRITGKLAGTNFDQTYTSGEGGKKAQSEGTFDDIKEPAEVKFPVKDPSNGELADKTGRIDARLVAAQRELKSDADSAGTKGLLALIVGGLGLLIGLAALVSARRTKKAA